MKATRSAPSQCTMFRPPLPKLRRREPVIRARPLLRVAATKQLIHIADITKDAGFPAARS